MLGIVGRFKLMEGRFYPLYVAGITNGGMAVAMGYIPFLKNGVVFNRGGCRLYDHTGDAPVPEVFAQTDYRQEHLYRRRPVSSKKICAWPRLYRPG
jgi:hypothetical protein